MAAPSTRVRALAHLRRRWPLVLLVLALVLGEVWARRIDPQLPAWRLEDEDNDSVMLTGHATRLWGLGKGRRDNLNASATIGEHGLRGDPPELPRPAGQQRVMVLGDSTFFGYGVPDGAALSDVLLAQLRAAGVAADMVNAGVPGYSTAQTRLLLEEVGWDLQPTLLVLGSFWSDSNWEPFADADLLRTTRMARWNPLVHSALFRLIATKLRPPGSGGRVVTWTRASGWPSVGRRRVPLADYAGNLDLIAREAASRGCGVIFVSPPSVFGAADPGAESHWDPYRRAQRAVAAHHGLPVVDADASFHQLYAQRVAAGEPERQVLSDLFFDEVHPSREGHRRLGRLIAEELQAAGWPGDPLQADPARPFDAAGAAAWDDWLDRAEPGKLGSPLVNLFDTRGTIRSPQGTPGMGEKDNHWVVGGVVRSRDGRGPVTIDAVTPDGMAVGRAQLPEPGRFSLRISLEHPVVVLNAAGPGGSTSTEVKEAAENLLLVLQ